MNPYFQIQRAKLFQAGLAALLFGILLLSLSPSFSVVAGKINSEGGDNFVYMPAVFMPPPFPDPPQSAYEVTLEITPGGGINASTYNTGAFIITNSAVSAEPLTEIVIDLRTAAFPDMVFDPYGTAGDQVAKDVTIDSNPAVVGFSGHSYSSPHDGGFDILTLQFNDFDPGEAVSFSVDVDPTSIKGVPAPGPAESGSVSGLELSGATVSVLFENNFLITGSSLPTPGSNSGSTALIRENLPPQPVVDIENIPVTPVIVSSANQVVEISGGPIWSTAVVEVIEGGLFTAGLPGGGYDIDPYEANSAIQINRFSQPVDYDGLATIPISLTRANAQGGINHLVVYFEDYYGYPGLPAPTIVIELAP